MASEVKTNKISPVGSTVTLGDASDVFQLPASAEIDIASGATLDVNGTIDVTGATKTGFPEELFSSYAVIVDSKASTSGGGGFTSGAWRTRDLNLEIADPDGIVSISSNEFTLAAGSYLITWSCPHHQVTNCETRLYDVTGTAHVQSGSSGYSGTGANTQGRDMGAARVTPSGSNVYRIEHRCDVTNGTNGFGVSVAYGETIIFTIVEIFKEA